ncbi:lysoplasmalogenase [Gordoniibacillus kamchatkensis]|uniref:lysoplasmalogenase n=1 Tax=Gordoniibacillus kamchatkensis TaxID=1590651 RepID=UPI0006966C19|nr:lysoplasmalogenase [Paenibacillus sp. VKM B-2647]
MYKKLLIAAILVSGLGYLFALADGNMLLRWILKPGTIVLMIILASTAAREVGTYRNWVIAGLFFSAVGDSFLLMQGTEWFSFGVFSFLIAHLIYISAFITRWRFSAVHLLYLIPIALYSFFLLRGLHEGMITKNAGGMWGPILIYVIVISLMIWSAVISRSWVAITGAILFFLSDSLLAWNMFVNPIPLADFWVMVTYYTAQFMIAASIERPPHHKNMITA